VAHLKYALPTTSVAAPRFANHSVATNTDALASRAISTNRHKAQKDAYVYETTLVAIHALTIVLAMQSATMSPKDTAVNVFVDTLTALRKAHLGVSASLQPHHQRRQDIPAKIPTSTTAMLPGLAVPQVPKPTPANACLDTSIVLPTSRTSRDAFVFLRSPCVSIPIGMTAIRLPFAVNPKVEMVTHVVAVTDTAIRAPTNNAGLDVSVWNTSTSVLIAALTTATHWPFVKIWRTVTRVVVQLTPSISHPIRSVQAGNAS
jgi:hypothetical protein